MIEIGVDIGGTFTDVVLLRDHARLHHTKVPTTPADPIGGVTQGVEKILAATGAKPGEVARFTHGSTVAINALLQKKGSCTGVLMTEGFEDTLEIGRQKRSRMYDLALEPETPAFLAPRRRRFGIPGRIAADGTEVKPLDEAAVRRAARLLVEKHGVTAIAVCYLFSFRNEAHERRTRELIAAEFPAVHVSLSCEVDPTFREYERLVVTALDAYLQGAVGDYVERLRARLAAMGIGAELQVMQSRGGITSAASIARRPVALLLSGLAAGVVGSKFVAEAAGHPDAISLDIGGTSCDIALIRAGKPIVAAQSRVAGLPLRQQMIDVNTIGAGGGSIAWLDDAGGLRVGPHSAGADPGPACYGRGGTDATVTDASVVLGYLNPRNFAAGELELDADAAHAAIARIGRRLGLDPVAAAAGIHRILNARMADEVRRVSVQRGYDPRRFALLPLGGGGPVHAGVIAAELAMPRIVVPETPGVLSAFGLLVAAVEHDQAETYAVRADRVDSADLDRRLARLDARGSEKMRGDGIDPAAVARRAYADMRYVGQSYELSVEIPIGSQDAVGDAIGAAVAAFHKLHQSLYGHASPQTPVEFVNLRTVHSHALPPPGIERAPARAAAAARCRKAYFPALGRFVDTPVHDRRELAAGAAIAGPAIVEQTDTTLVVYPGQRAHVDAGGSIIVEANANGA
jgi:N-methylhydantoinase A